MQPQQLRKLVRRWTIPVVVITVIAAGVAFAVSRTLQPIYSATGSVLIVAAPGGSANNGVSPLNASQVTTTAAALMTEPPLLQQVIGELHLGGTADDLAKRVTATPETNTELVDVMVKDPDPALAATIANRVMSDYVDQVTQANQKRVDQAGAALQGQITQLGAQLSKDEDTLAPLAQRRQDTTQIKAQIQAETATLSQLTTNYSSFKAAQAQNEDSVSVAAAAATPTSPSSPKVLLNTILGGMAGLLIAVGLASLLEYLDQGLHSEADVTERLGVPCLGVIPRFTATRPGDPVAKGRRGKNSARHSQAAGEAFRRLRTNLVFSGLDEPLTSVVVTSVHPGEGKTRTAANLAVALAGAEKEVLLIDADMRKPSQHKVFDKPLYPGFSDVLIASAQAGTPVAPAIHTTKFPGLGVMTCGTIPPNPSELLASRRSVGVLRALESQHDIVVIDTPPAEALTDAVSAAANASATILVVEAGRTNATEAATAIAALRKVGAKVVGVVINKAREKDVGAYYYYDYSEKKGTPIEPLASNGALTATGERHPEAARSR